MPGRWLGGAGESTRLDPRWAVQKRKKRKRALSTCHLFRSGPFPPFRPPLTSVPKAGRLTINNHILAPYHNLVYMGSGVMDELSTQGVSSRSSGCLFRLRKVLPPWTARRMSSAQDHTHAHSKNIQRSRLPYSMSAYIAHTSSASYHSCTGVAPPSVGRFHAGSWRGSRTCSMPEKRKESQQEKITMNSVMRMILVSHSGRQFAKAMRKESKEREC